MPDTREPQEHGPEFLQVVLSYGLVLLPYFTLLSKGVCSSDVCNPNMWLALLLIQTLINTIGIVFVSSASEGEVRIPNAIRIAISNTPIFMQLVTLLVGEPLLKRIITKSHKLGVMSDVLYVVFSFDIITFVILLELVFSDMVRLFLKRLEQFPRELEERENRLKAILKLVFSSLRNEPNKLTLIILFILILLMFPLVLAIAIELLRECIIVLLLLLPQRGVNKLEMIITDITSTLSRLLN